MAIRNNTVSPKFGQNKIFTFLIFGIALSPYRVKVHAQTEVEARSLLIVKIGVKAILVTRQVEGIA